MYQHSNIQIIFNVVFLDVTASLGDCQSVSDQNDKPTSKWIISKRYTISNRLTRSREKQQDCLLQCQAQLKEKAVLETQP